MKTWLPLFVLLGGLGAAVLLIITGPKVQPRESASVKPLVRAVTVAPALHQFNVQTHGSVTPRTESELVPEVGGRVIAMSSALVSGGFFDKGDVLLEIDRLDYEVALEQAHAGVARALSELNNAQKTSVRQKDLVSRGAVSDAEVDDSTNQVRVAQARLREAKAQLSRARRDLERTRIVAPYDGRVRSERVDIGQFVRRGDRIGTLYAVDYAEVRLPVPNADLAYLNLPLGRTSSEFSTQPKVILRANFAGVAQRWEGLIVRTEGELDPTTRMIHVVAQIPEPYSVDDSNAPLAVGMFVEAEILGQRVAGVSILPRAALRGRDQVLVVDDNDQLRFRQVKVLRLADEEVYIGGGLEQGERVCVSPLQNTVEGLRVRIIEAAEA